MADLEPASEHSEVQNPYEKLLVSGEYSDLKIVCQDMAFNVHQCIICPQSSFFRAAVKHPFKESSTRVIELPADQPETVERVIVYLYLRDYRQNGHIIPMATAENDGPSHVGLNHADVYVTADKYDIPPLKTLAASKMTSWAKSNFKTSGFIVMARHILQLKHDNWPYDFVSQCIRDNVGSLTRDDVSIFKLIGDFGLLGGAVLMGILESNMLHDPRLEAENAREKSRLQDQVAALKQEVVALQQEVAGLKRDKAVIQHRLESREAEGLGTGERTFYGRR